MMAKRVEVDIRTIYQSLRAFVMAKDGGCLRGNLKRCYLPSGKTLWLCSEHQKLPRVTVLDDPVFSNETDEGYITSFIKYSRVKASRFTLKLLCFRLA